MICCNTFVYVTPDIYFLDVANAMAEITAQTCFGDSITKFDLIDAMIESIFFFFNITYALVYSRYDTFQDK